MIVLRTQLIAADGKKASAASSSPAERSFLSIAASTATARCWLIGGIDPEDETRLLQIQQEAQPIDEWDLRLVHWHPVRGNDQALVVHYTRGQERIKYELERTARIPLHLALSRTLKESTAAAQHFTSRLLLQHPHCRSALNSFTAQPAEEDHHLIDLFWPGKQTPMRATLTVRMLPGWNDTRLVSKRCILLQEPAADAARAVTSRSSHLARISAITAIDTASGSAYTGSVPDSAAASDSGSPMIIVEGQAKWLRNERDACPLVPRVAFAFVDGQDSLGLLKGLRESFEIINRPWMLSSLVGSSGCSLVSSGSINSNNNINSSISSIINIPAIKQSQLPSIEFAPITTHPSSSKNTTAAAPPPLPPCSPSALLSDLFEAKPWSSLPFPLAYSAYRMFCGERQWPPSSEIAFAKAMKGAGFCLKDGMGSVIKEDALGEAEAEAEGKRSGWYWYHVQLKSA